MKYFFPLVQNNKFYGLLIAGYWYVEHSNRMIGGAYTLQREDYKGFVEWEKCHLACTDRSILYPIRYKNKDIIWREKPDV